ncbi:mitochondrial 18 KDa protein-domain-containing protein [Calycina marina]|uniref:Mitochondrial fission process protein 1 n=1 Tax=Calycina marina TaxID=1763456 RepID=A0A9P7Z6L3_9HELO|nr:mitochondrial 18 KDa protein-domain-containing protein [Calycina marina]
MSDKPEKPQGPAPTGLPANHKLPASLQSIVDEADRDENFYDELYDGLAPPTTESNIRYAAYFSRIRTAVLSAQRYVAYTSDIGESFRPVAHPRWVTAAYGISWAYLLGDVSHEGYKAYCSNQRILHPGLPREAAEAHYNDAKTSTTVIPSTGTEASLTPGKVAPIDDFRTVMAQRAIFQGIASMGLPAFTIHSIVRYSGRVLKNSKNVKVRTWGPIGLGLAAVPALPYMFDKPVEEAVEWVFHAGFKTLDGKETVGSTPSTGREKENQTPVAKSNK